MLREEDMSGEQVGKEEIPTSKWGTNRRQKELSMFTHIHTGCMHSIVIVGIHEGY